MLAWLSGDMLSSLEKRKLFVLVFIFLEGGGGGGVGMGRGSLLSPF